MRVVWRQCLGRVSNRRVPQEAVPVHRGLPGLHKLDPHVVRSRRRVDGLHLYADWIHGYRNCCEYLPVDVPEPTCPATVDRIMRPPHALPWLIRSSHVVCIALVCVYLSVYVCACTSGINFCICILQVSTFSIAVGCTAFLDTTAAITSKASQAAWKYYVGLHKIYAHAQNRTLSRRPWWWSAARASRRSLRRICSLWCGGRRRSAA